MASTYASKIDKSEGTDRMGSICHRHRPASGGSSIRGHCRTVWIRGAGQDLLRRARARARLPPPASPSPTAPGNYRGRQWRCHRRPAWRGARPPGTEQGNCSDPGRRPRGCAKSKQHSNWRGRRTWLKKIPRWGSRRPRQRKADAARAVFKRLHFDGVRPTRR